MAVDWLIGSLVFAILNLNPCYRRSLSRGLSVVLARVESEPVPAISLYPQPLLLVNQWSCGKDKRCMGQPLGRPIMRGRTPQPSDQEKTWIVSRREVLQYERLSNSFVSMTLESIFTMNRGYSLIMNLIQLSKFCYTNIKGTCFFRTLHRNISNPLYNTPLKVPQTLSYWSNLLKTSHHVQYAHTCAISTRL